MAFKRRFASKRRRGSYGRRKTTSRRSLARKVVRALRIGYRM